MIKELIHRRIPHIIGSYLFAGSSLILFIDWLIARYEFPEHYVTLSLFGIASIIPSVVILAYFHGAPGKDEWTKIEKIGIPINVIFIALVMVLGNNYNWWTKGNDKNIVEKPKGLILGEIKSNEDNIEFIKRKLYGSSADKTTLDVLSGIEKSNIYDELTSFIEINNIRDDIDYITKYDLIERFNKKGEEVPKYSFKYFREFSAIDPNSENKMKQQMKILGKIHTNKTSTYNFLINSSADLGYFPLLYKINTSADKIEYCLFHCLVYNEIKFTEQDTSKNFKFLISWDILERSDLVEAMADLAHSQATIGNFAAAKDLYEQSLNLSVELEDLSGQLVARWGLADIAEINEDYETAMLQLSDCLHSFLHVGLPTPLAVRQRIEDLADYNTTNSRQKPKK